MEAPDSTGQVIRFQCNNLVPGDIALKTNYKFFCADDVLK